MVGFGVLGTVEVRVGDQVLSAGHARQQCVLAALLVDAGRLVTTDQLAERVWGERQPQRARAALHGYVSRLRRIVARAGDTAVERHGGGYVLRVDAAAVDLHRFRDLNTRARAADDGHAVALYDEALALWRGEPLGAVESAWADELRAGLRHERLVAETERNDRALRQGWHEHLLTELTARAAEYPLDERLAAQLILALYRSGRAAEALDAYQRVRRQVVEELGIDPGEPLQRLYQRILARDTTLTVPRRPEAVAPAVTRAARQLPPTVRHLIGRDDELAYLDARLETLKDGSGCGSGSALVITITGGGGVGKTTLAQSWARRVGEHFPDGQLHLDLRGFGPGESPLPAAEALHRLLDSLGVGPDRLPAATDDRTALLRSLTENRRLLVVLDNAHDTAQVRPLLPGGGECLVLVTSRRRLPGLIVHHQAQHLALDVLAPQAARDLVVGRLSETRAAADPQALDDLVAHCGGLPLALAIVAARLLTNPAMPLRSLLDELRDQHAGLQALSVDEGPDSDLVAAFSWSYRALTPPAARMFRLLALHPGPDIVLPAVASLAAETCAAARALLEELADASLLQRSGTGRYRLHDLLRAYAGTRLTADEPAAPRRAAELRLLDHYLLSTSPTTTVLASTRWASPRWAATVGW
ncbi:AfsR/SARP family transcriptional regulator [Streptomyces murinus]|uniref:AfsR/SARP family transcriptional regulator n=1 Tax=Streptomyces murinus TaxID=33900 RepID=UPI0036E2F649